MRATAMTGALVAVTAILIAFGAALLGRARRGRRAPAAPHAGRGPGAGLTYCEGFELGVSPGAGSAVAGPGGHAREATLVVEVVHVERGGNLLAPPRSLLRLTVDARLDGDGIRIGRAQQRRVRLDDRPDASASPLGHPCAELLRLRLSEEAGGHEGAAMLEAEIRDTQSGLSARVVRGDGWTAAIDRAAVHVTGHGVEIRYLPLHGHVD